MKIGDIVVCYPNTGCTLNCIGYIIALTCETCIKTNTCKQFSKISYYEKNKKNTFIIRSYPVTSGNCCQVDISCLKPASIERLLEEF